MPDTFFGAGDIQPMLDTVGVSVTIGAVTAKCIRDMQDDAVASAEDGSLVGRMVTLIAKTGTFPALVEGVAATVEGTAYTVRQQVLLPGEMEDGALTLIRCSKV